MKYKIGDKVVIRTWEDMEEECGVETYIFDGIGIKGERPFYSCMEEELAKLNANRKLTIVSAYTNVNGFEYSVEELSYIIDSKWIEKQNITPILSRFEILDL